MMQEDIKVVVKQAVHETLSGLGMSADRPHEMQADFIYIRKVRKGSEAMSNKIRMSLITVTIPTFLYLLWDAVKGLIAK